MREIGVGLLGLGNVGAGAWRLLEENAEGIGARLGARVVVRRVAVREAEKGRAVEVPAGLLTTDAAAVVADPSVDVVVEVIGGEEPARELVLEAIRRRKQVVTANKALLATHGEEIFDAAAKAGVDVFYEAAVCGGVPIIRALRDGLASDRISEIVGIVNGTSNFILSTMTDAKRGFDDVLAEAQRLGYAEADPSLDVDGWDAAHKLCVLATLCFGARLQPKDLLVEGLRALTPTDLAYAERFGYVIKPLVLATDHGESVSARVHPTMIPRRFLLASVAGPFNALYVSSQALGQSLYYGRGAGMMPTAVAIVSDIIDVSRELLTRAAAPSAPRRPRDLRARPLKPAGELTSRYYLRFTVADRPGVLGQLATVLGSEGVSLREVVQEPGAPAGGGPATVVVTTHEAIEANVQRALARIDALPVAAAKTVLIRIFE